MRATVFLDRDGTLCEDQVHGVDVARLRLTPYAREAAQLWAATGWRLVLVTNNSGIARGLFDQAAMERYHDALQDELGVRFDAVYHCPHADEDGCECRKPKPGLLHRARRELGVDLATSYVVGDSWRDVAAGRAAGAWTILVPGGRDGEGDETPDHRARHLLDAAEWSLARRKA